ncbi:MAG: tetratricopeptide repeat protein [Pyrinomonadaceae bacterium]
MPTNVQSGFKSTRLMALAAILLLPGLLAPSAFTQGDPPVKKDRLVSILRSKQYQAREIVSVINEVGVDFQLTPAVESELVAAGARPSVLAAVRENYRRPATPAVARTNNTAPSNARRTNPATPAGPPLTKDAVVALLQNGVAVAQVQRNVESRGVNFTMNRAIAQEIKAAGGNDALIGAIASNAVSSAGNNGSVNYGNSSASNNNNRGAGYTEIIERAINMTKANDVNGATALLQQAIQMDASRPAAYQTLGFIALYGRRNFTEAEGYSRQAIERGGSAVFRVDHDHDGIFQQTCQGSLYVSRDTVNFEADDGEHTFGVNDTDIKNIKTNNAFFRAFQEKKGSFKISLKRDDGSKNYNFAPLTGALDESKMIIRLVDKQKSN